MVLNSLPILIVEAHSRCNCRCEMCDIWRSTEVRQFTPEQLEAQLDSIDSLGVRQVVFTGGEPLMNPQLFDLCRPLRERGIGLTLLSTGLLLERFAAEVRDHFDEVIVSLDGPRAVHDEIRRTAGAFDQLARGVAAISTVRTSARCVVQRRNHDQLLATAAVAQELGLRSISYLAADVTSNAFGRTGPLPILGQHELALTWKELDTLQQQVSGLKQQAIVADSPNHLDRILELFRAHLGANTLRAPRCNAPMVSAYLHADGALQPCFFHPAIGSTRLGSLAEELNSGKAAAFRATLDVETNPVCRQCVCSLFLDEPRP